MFFCVVLLSDYVVIELCKVVVKYVVDKGYIV